jgi:large subunit ribosomal protein L24
MKIKKGDKVKIISGKDKGREGKVERVLAKSGKIVIPGINLYKRHIKKNDKMPQGGIVDLPRPIAANKVMLVCPKCKKPTRVGYLVNNKKKVRICRRCQSKL